jgi:hypothetical protein
LGRIPDIVRQASTYYRTFPIDYCGKFDKTIFEDNRKIFLRFKALLVAIAIKRKPLDVPGISEKD